MRPSSFFCVLAVAVHSRPISPFDDSFFGNLQDLIYKSVGSLFPYPYGPYNYGGSDCHSCNFASKSCITQCVPDCQGGADACSNCLSACFSNNVSCFNDDASDETENGNEDGSDDEANNPPPPEEPQADPTPAATP